MQLLFIYKMSYCHHGVYNTPCAICKYSVNTCCTDKDAPDTECDVCRSSFCYDCFCDCDECPVCTGNIVTDDQILKYILENYDLDKTEIIKNIKSVHKKTYKKQLKLKYEVIDLFFEKNPKKINKGKLPEYDVFASFFYHWQSDYKKLPKSFKIIEISTHDYKIYTDNH